MYDNNYPSKSTGSQDVTQEQGTRGQNTPAQYQNGYNGYGSNNHYGNAYGSNGYGRESAQNAYGNGQS